MITIKMSKDIKKQQSKMFWGLTGRQLFFTVLAIFIAIVVNSILDLNDTVKAVLVISTSIPFLLCGWITINGLTFEKFAVVWIRNNFNNKERIFINESGLDHIKPIKEKSKRK